MDKLRFEKLKEAVVELDAFLTEKGKMANHMMVSQAEEFERMILDRGEYVYYLADGGMSRIVLKLHPNFEPYCNPTVFFTYHSTQKVKDRWNLEEAQKLVRKVVSIMFTPDTTMIANFRKEVVEHTISFSTRIDWYWLTIGWGLAKGLSPLNAQNFASYVETSSNRPDPVYLITTPSGMIWKV